MKLSRVCLGLIARALSCSAAAGPLIVETRYRSELLNTFIYTPSKFLSKNPKGEKLSARQQKCSECSHWIAHADKEFRRAEFYRRELEVLHRMYFQRQFHFEELSRDNLLLRDKLQKSDDEDDYLHDAHEKLSKV